jgi:hypothetical protein
VDSGARALALLFYKVREAAQASRLRHNLLRRHFFVSELTS